MKNTFYLLCLSLLSIPAFGQYAIPNTEATTETVAIVNNAPDIAIIPEPVSVIKSEGYFCFLQMSLYKPRQWQKLSRWWLFYKKDFLFQQEVTLLR
ncbi:hypothetical protein [Pedobacter panaciterrae]